MPYGHERANRSEFDEVMEKLDAVERRQDAADRRHSDADGDLTVEAAGIKTRASGKLAVFALIPMLIAVGVIYVVLGHEKADADRAALITTNQQSIVHKQDQLQESADAIVYVLTLDENQRKGLKLDMPESLRRKAR